MNMRKVKIMDYNKDKVAEAALALLYLTLRNKYRAWKGLDWDIMNRLHERGYVFDPKNKNKSIEFTEEGLHKAEGLFKQLFGEDEEQDS
jgi:hypothetical protein